MPRKWNKNKQADKLDEEGGAPSESSSSDEDQNAKLLTKKVEYKLLSTIAKLKAQKLNPKLLEELRNIKKPIFDDSDFQSDGDNEKDNTKDKKQEKYTYKKMVQQQYESDSSHRSESEELAPVQEEKRAKQKFKRAISKVQEDLTQKEQTDENSLFKVKKTKSARVSNDSKEITQKRIQGNKFAELLSEIPAKSKAQKKQKQLVEQVWGNQQNLDETDLFLKRYIINKKWLSKKLDKGQQGNEVIEEEDQERSQEMDQYEAQYNLRHQQPDGNKITYFPRTIEESIRNKPESRKQKRKAVQKRKRQEEDMIREQAERRRQEIKIGILDKLTGEQNQGQQPMDKELDHDWFFCDDCGKGLADLQTHYACAECEDYILCDQCFELIIHPHNMDKSKVPQGFGAPQEEACEKVISTLKSCNKCRKKVVPNKNRYEYTDRSYLTTTLCEKCLDSSNLEIKKKYKLIEGHISTNNAQQIEQLLDQNPEKIKELTNLQEVEDMIDQYVKNQFEDILADGTKAKFRYIQVKPESYGLSDQQILFGDDKQLNKYVSIKKLAPYGDDNMRLRSSFYNQKIKSIQKSVKDNKKLLLKPQRFGVTDRGTLGKLKRRSAAMKEKRIHKELDQKRVRITNLSDPEKEKKKFVPSSRLASYGISQ